MNIFGLNISFGRKSADSLDINTLIKRLDAVYETYSGISVTPENCEQAPTVKAAITAITNRFGVMPPHVLQKTTSGGRTVKEPLPSHPVEKLLAKPNGWQSRADYWRDAVSRYLRYGNFYAFQARGVTGPIRQLVPLDPSQTEPKQDADWNVTIRTRTDAGGYRELPYAQVHHVRTAARNGIKGDSPIIDVRETIALEIAAEKFGASFFGNGALPGFVFEYMDGSQGFKTDEERRAFLDEFQERYTKQGRFRAILPPKGIKMGSPIPIENDKAQFLQLRQHQRTVIAGALGIPPHLVGDLSKGTFNNVEQQDANFTINAILPIARVFEAAMERDLLTQEDRNAGVIIRFNLDAIMRADFQKRQSGLNTMRMAGVINANEWREMEGMNPRPGGDAYYEQGPSGQNGDRTSDQSDPSPDDDEEDDDDAA